MSATLIFNQSGRNKKYVPENDKKPKEEILEKLARESYSTFNTWPQESPKAGYYDTKYSPTKLIILNNQKKWSHLRGKTKAKQEKLVKDNNYEWVEIEKMKHSQFPKSKVLARSQSSRSVNPTRHFSPRHCTFKAEYDDTLMLPVDMKKHNEKNKTTSRLFSSLTKSKFDDIDEIEWLAYLHAMGVRTTGYQTRYKRPVFPIEYRSSYNLNHPKFDKNYMLYLSELYKSYSVTPLKNLKQLQYMTLLKQRKEIDRNCKRPYRFHRGDDFYTYEDHLAKSRPVPHQVNTGYFSTRRAKSARPVGRRYASPRPSKAQLYDTDNCEEGRKTSQNKSNSEMSQAQLQQSIVNQSGSMLDDSTLNHNNNQHTSSSTATKTTASSSRLVSASSSSSSSSSESGSPRPNIQPSNQSTNRTNSSAASSSSKPQFIKRIKAVPNAQQQQQQILPSRNTASASSASLLSRKNSPPSTPPKTSPKTTAVKLESGRKSLTSSRTPTPDPFNRSSVVQVKTEPTLATLNSKSSSSRSSTPKASATTATKKLPSSRSNSSSSLTPTPRPKTSPATNTKRDATALSISSSSRTPDRKEKPPQRLPSSTSESSASPPPRPKSSSKTDLKRPATSSLSTSSSSRTQTNQKEQKPEPKRAPSGLSTSSSSSGPLTPAKKPAPSEQARKLSNSSDSSITLANTGRSNADGQKTGPKYTSSSASSFVLKNKETTIDVRKKTPDSLDKLMKKKTLESSDSD